ncbi:MAG: hypothetical protein H6822_29905 [Planctomycetaceae bacterium]|nr:hypothetical protein [Planctomycetales bacterium]MCB9926399.1 hypothetical protein [Planctomycetaceae bacterium]
MSELSTNDSFESFRRRLNDGTHSAIHEVDIQYRDRLCVLVERKMNARYRRREDPEDVVQSALRTFFRRAPLGEFDIKDPQHLWRTLQLISRRKMLKHIDKITAGQRGFDREEHCDQNELPSAPAETPRARLLGDVLEMVLAGMHAPDPEVLRLQLFGYTIAEIIEIVTEGLETTYVQILQLRLQGRTESAIGEELGIGREAVRCRIKRITKRLQTLLK